MFKLDDWKPKESIFKRENFLTIGEYNAYITGIIEGINIAHEIHDEVKTKYYGEN